MVKYTPIKHSIFIINKIDYGILISNLVCINTNSIYTQIYRIKAIKNFDFKVSNEKST